MKEFDIVVLGGGPAGYVAAIRAAQLGYSTAVIDMDRLGGICLNWGCIPTKALLKSAELFDSIKNHSDEFGISVGDVNFDLSKIVSRSREVSAKISQNIELLLKKHKIARYNGKGSFVDSQTLSINSSSGEAIETLKGKKIIVATGAYPVQPGFITFDRKHVITAREAMVPDSLPSSLTIIGAGAIGVEFAYFYAVLGTKVTIIEMQDHLLPIEDEEISSALEKSFAKRGISYHVNAKVQGVTVSESERLCTVSFEKNGQTTNINSEKVLCAIGVKGNISGFGLEKIGVKTDNGYISVNKLDFQTNIPGIYAVGDVIGAPWLAHVASAEAIHCVESIHGSEFKEFDYSNIPGCTYCHPQVASVGMTEKKAREAGYSLKIGKFPFMASGKAFAVGEREGFVKLIFDEKYGELLGAHIIGANATELIGELGIARELEATAKSIIKTIHAHPTLSESIMEAAAAAYGESVHA
ncbi:MAG: dihydrolipoyl dehydrogenase [Ignavibacteria bacterium]|nr:dihydrolipoyl dehydrogenase [Ignavibacteria bacterium]